LGNDNTGHFASHHNYSSFDVGQSNSTKTGAIANPTEESRDKVGKSGRFSGSEKIRMHQDEAPIATAHGWMGVHAELRVREC
jgi:hypothetical protein